MFDPTLNAVQVSPDRTEFNPDVLPEDRARTERLYGKTEDLLAKVDAVRAALLNEFSGDSTGGGSVGPQQIQSERAAWKDMEPEERLFPTATGAVDRAAEPMRSRMIHGPSSFREYLRASGLPADTPMDDAAIADALAAQTAAEGGGMRGAHYRDWLNRNFTGWKTAVDEINKEKDLRATLQATLKEKEAEAEKKRGEAEKSRGEAEYYRTAPRLSKQDEKKAEYLFALAKDLHKRIDGNEFFGPEREARLKEARGYEAEANALLSGKQSAPGGLQEKAGAIRTLPDGSYTNTPAPRPEPPTEFMAQADLVEQGLKAGAPGAARALEELVKRATKPEEKARVAGLRAQLPQQGKKPGGKGGTEIGVSTAGHSDEFTPPPGYDMRIDKVNEDAKRETQEANYRTLISALMYAKTPEARAVIKNKAEQDVANGEITDAQMRLILSEYTGREYRGRR